MSFISKPRFPKFNIPSSSIKASVLVPLISVLYIVVLEPVFKLVISEWRNTVLLSLGASIREEVDWTTGAFSWMVPATVIVCKVSLSDNIISPKSVLFPLTTRLSTISTLESIDTSSEIITFPKKFPVPDRVKSEFIETSPLNVELWFTIRFPDMSRSEFIETSLFTTNVSSIVILTPVSKTTVFMIKLFASAVVFEKTTLFSL